jgi:histidinol dehydrogenase
MTTMGTGPGNPAGRPRGSRNRAILNEEFIAALLRHFRREGERAIARMAATQPAAYCKLLTLLVPREHRIEHSNAIKDLTDEQLEAMIEHLKASLEAQAQSAKVIEGEAEVVPSLPAPARPTKAS